MFARTQLIWLLLILLCCAGCATARSRSLFARPTKASTTPQDEPEPSEQQTARPKREPLVAGTHGNSTSRKSRHDPATRLLIQTELRNLPEDERQEWLAYFEQVETSQVGKELHDLRKNVSSAALAGNATDPGSKNPEQSSRPQIGHGHFGFDQSEQVKQAAADQDEGAQQPVKPISGTISEQPLGGNSDRPPAEDDRLRRFRAMPDWDAPRLWPAARDPGNDAATSDLQRSGRFPFPGRKPTREGSPVEQIPTATDAVSADTPINANASVWENEMRRLISLLEADAIVPQAGMSQSDQHEYLRRQIALRMLYLMEKDPAQAQQTISGLPPAEQEFWSSLFWGLSSYVDDASHVDPAERATLTIEQLRSAIHHLQTKAHLELKNLNFCQAIHAFGNYDPFELNQFSAGQTVLLYSEVRNFRSEGTSTGDYRTILKSSLEIYRDSGDGALVERNSFEATEDRCRSPRDDYFHSYRIDLPSHLTPGAYLLRLKVEDQLGGKSATESIPFEIR